MNPQQVQPNGKKLFWLVLLDAVCIYALNSMYFATGTNETLYKGLMLVLAIAGLVMGIVAFRQVSAGYRIFLTLLLVFILFLGLAAALALYSNYALSGL